MWNRCHWKPLTGKYSVSHVQTMESQEGPVSGNEQDPPQTSLELYEIRQWCGIWRHSPSESKNLDAAWSREQTISCFSTAGFISHFYYTVSWTKCSVFKELLDSEIDVYNSKSWGRNKWISLKFETWEWRKE